MAICVNRRFVSKPTMRRTAQLKFIVRVDRSWTNEKAQSHVQQRATPQHCSAHKHQHSQHHVQLTCAALQFYKIFLHFLGIFSVFSNFLIFFPFAKNLRKSKRNSTSKFLLNISALTEFTHKTELQKTDPKSSKLSEKKQLENPGKFEKNSKKSRKNSPEIS